MYNSITFTNVCYTSILFHVIHHRCKICGFHGIKDSQRRSIEHSAIQVHFKPVVRKKARFSKLKHAWQRSGSASALSFVGVSDGNSLSALCGIAGSSRHPPKASTSARYTSTQSGRKLRSPLESLSRPSPVQKIKSRCASSGPALVNDLPSWSGWTWGNALTVAT